MIALLFLSVICCAVLFWCILARERLLTAPFLMAVVFALWVLPQLFFLATDSSIPSAWVARASILSGLCLIGFLVGYRIPAGSRAIFPWRPSEANVVVLAVALAGVGGLAFFLLVEAAPEANQEFSGAWTGTITIYAFFKRLLAYSFALALLAHLRFQTQLGKVLLAFNGVLIAYLIIVLGRRADTVELVLMLALAALIIHSWVPKRRLVLVTVVVGALWVSTIGAYREFTAAAEVLSWWEFWSRIAAAGAQIQIQDLTHIDMGQLFEDFDAQEMRNVAVYVEAIDRTGVYLFGASIWNALVFGFVPAQLVGEELKASLMITTTDPALHQFGYVPWPGSTLTGMVDAFWDFGYFAPIKFAAAGYVYRRLFNAAKEGDFPSQVLLLVLTVPMLHIVTHSVNWFFREALQAAIFILLPLYLFNKAPRPAHGASALA